MDHHWQASHHASSPNGSDGEDASTEAAATQEIAQLPSNVNPLPPAFDEHTQICPPQVPHTASFNRIIHGVMEGHYLPGEERASAVLDCAQNNTLGDESLSNAPFTLSLYPATLTILTLVLLTQISAIGCMNNVKLSYSLKKIFHRNKQSVLAVPIHLLQCMVTPQRKSIVVCVGPIYRLRSTLQPNVSNFI